MNPHFCDKHYPYGYLRFPIDLPKTFSKCYQLCFKTISLLGRNLCSELENDRFLVEFGSPNIAKPLHPGHIRSLIHGSFIFRLIEMLSETRMVSICYFGDWGKQFAIILAEKQGITSIENLTLDDIVNIYVDGVKSPDIVARAEAVCGIMERSENPTFLNFWNDLKRLSLAHCGWIFKKLSINFDVFEYESDYFSQANKSICDRLLLKGLAKEFPDGSVVYEGKEENDLRTDGTSRDIAAFLNRKSKYSFDRMLYVCDSGQRLHFSRLLEILQRMGEAPVGWTVDDVHIGFGKVINFRTRAGSSTLLSDVIEDATSAARDAVHDEAQAQVLALTHLILNDTLRPRLKPYRFSIDQLQHHKSLAFRIQYCHARLCSLLNKSAHLSESPTAESCVLTNEREVSLIHELLRFADVCHLAYLRNFEAYLLTQYTIELCSTINRTLESQFVINENDQNVKLARYQLFHMSKQVLAECMRLLGIVPLSKISKR
ncbi:hypothetical protein ACOME3_006814 [Neoechinorhynchus agilis]